MTGESVSQNSASWKQTVAGICAILLGIIFLVSGGWKVLSPFQTGELLEQAQVPAGLGVLGAAALGTIELFAAFLLFTSRFRRWGGLLGAALILFFMCWIGYYYNALVGHECSCFPLIKRSIGPGFFVSDGAMLIFGLLAFLWSRPAPSFRIPAVAFVSLVVLSGLSFGVNAAERRNIQVPTPIVVDGKPENLTDGKVFLFFYDPECSHCVAAARFMSKLDWSGTKIVGIPTHDPQFAADFLQDTKFKVDTSLETAKLRKAFPFVDPPFGVALVDGRVKETFGQAQFNEPLPKADLEKLGFVK